jgi:enamine deaminase RidA (YjgF/YER057c/UK114 family)
MEIIERALADLGAKLSDVVRTRIYLIDIAQWREAGKVHHEFFQHHPPVNTLVEISALIDSRLIVEIEAEAVVHSADE